MRIVDNVFDNAYVAKMKCSALLGLGIANMAMGVGSSVFGRANQSAAEREARRREDASYAGRQANYLRKEKERYADTSAGRAMLSEAREYGDSMFKKQAGANAVGGGTGESVAQQKEANNKMMSSVVRDMGARDTARQDAANTARMQNEAQHAQVEANRYRQDAANEAQALQNTVNAIGQGAASIATGAEKVDAENAANQAAMSSAKSKADSSAYLKEVSKGSNSAANDLLEQTAKKRFFG